MDVRERGREFVLSKQGYGGQLDFETFLPIADELFRLSVNFIVWQPTIITARKPDGSPVSSADKNAQRLVKNVLQRATPTIPVRGEEDAYERSVFETGGTYWSVDPIDGTRFYEAMKYEWCVSVALVVNGVPQVGIVLQPGRGECFVGIRGKGIQWRTEVGSWMSYTPLTPVSPMLMVSLSRSVLRNDHYTKQARCLTARFEDYFSLPSVLAVLEIVRGHAWGWASLFRPWHWDISAAFVLVHEVGGVAMCANGDPILWYMERTPPVVFALSHKKAAAICEVLNEKEGSSPPVW